MSKARFILTVFFVNLYARTSGAENLDTIDFKTFQRQAKEIGDELWSVGESITKRSEVQEKFAQARVVNKSGSRLVDEIARDLHLMLDVRIKALTRIVNEAEILPKLNTTDAKVANFTFVNTRARDKFRKEILREKAIRDEYLEKLSQDANYTKKRKPINESPICIKSNSPSDGSDGDDDEPDLGCFAKFNETVNVKLREASVFLPIDVFDKDENIIRAINRTKGLDKVFLENYRIEPTIGWQYFCNATGLFRHFPATEWEFHPVNLYDCRMRQWYTGAAASSKDVMILVERAGSMLGNRIGIAIDVVRNILDTLTPNDYVNIIQFNDTAEYLTECAKGLVQATSPNIYELKQALGSIEPSGQSDLAEALNEAFESLANHKNTSANCNQIIMLITDGMEYNQTIQNIFNVSNWMKGNNIRVFSFMIGSQIPENDFEQVKLMACENRGYYTQIDTASETRENALKYIQVIARPLELLNHSPIVWSNLYVDVLDTLRTTNNDWACKQNEMQRERVVDYLSEYDWYPCITRNDPEEPDPEFRKFVFMTTVSMPAFERVFNSSLMGVAGIDVPLFEFERLFQRHRLGVGGYAFIIDQNGNILTHPDFRPFFQGRILKPAYDAVDIAEVELMDDGYDPRSFSPYLLDFRQSIIDRPSGSKFMFALQPFDDMRRALRLERKYFWKRITQTPFTVVVTYPSHLSGRIQIPESEVDAMMSKGTNLAKLFKGDFRLHPDWIYCRGIRKGFEDIKLGLIDPDNCEMTPEEELVFYLEKFEESGWKWKLDGKLDSNETRCDRKLMQLLLNDAKATENFPADIAKRHIDNFRVKTSFISTHSGLLRFKIFDKKVRSSKFGDQMKKSIEEVWYKHAVEFNRHEPESFVYSVPFNAYELSDPKITATTTIYTRDGSDSVPIGIVGFQFAHSKLEEIMERNCPRNKEEFCFILDDNGYILSDPEADHTGKFFGSVERELMSILIDDKVYEPVTVFDYQAVCYEDKDITYANLLKRLNNSALNVFIWNPFKYFAAVFATLLSAAYALPSHMANLMYPDREHFYDDEVNKEFFCSRIQESNFTECLAEGKTNDTDDSHYLKCLEKKKQRWRKCNEERGFEYILKRHLNRSRPHKCDKFNVVYSLTKNESNLRLTFDECKRPFVVHKIAHSNLILLTTYRNCKPQVYVKEFNDIPQTVEYPNSTFCHKLLNPLFRSRPKSCMTHHAREPKFDATNKDRSQCGRGHKLSIHRLIFAFSIISTLLKMFAATETL